MMNIRVITDKSNLNLLAQWFVVMSGKNTDRYRTYCTCYFQSHLGKRLKPWSVRAQLLLKDTQPGTTSELCDTYEVRNMNVSEYIYLGCCMRSQNYMYNKKRDPIELS